MKLPGFDGDTLVCPVGSNDTADWKPALAYPPFKKALLEAVTVPAPVEAPKPFLPPMPAILPMAPAPAPIEAALPVPAPFPLPPAPAPAPVAAAPAPAPAPKTIECPRCAHANLEDARYCNKCGARMDGKVEDISLPAAPAPVQPPVPVAAPAPIPAEPLPSNDPFMPTSFPSSLPSAASPEPAFDPFGHLDPMRSFPAEPAPMAAAEPAKRPLQPGKMGQLGAYEEPSPSLASITPDVAPEPAPAAAAKPPLWKRPPVLAGIAAAIVVAAGLGYMTIGTKTPVETVAELTPSAPMPAPAPVAETPAPPAPPLYSTPPQTSSPSIPLPRAPKAAPKARPNAAPKTAAKPKKKIPRLNEPTLTPPSIAGTKPKRARKPRPAPAPKPEPKVESDFADTSGGGDTMIESRAPEPKAAPKGKRAAKAAKAQSAQKDPLLEALLTDATQPSPEAAAEPAADAEAPLAKPGEKAMPQIGQRAASAAKSEPFSLPGLNRPVSASDRAASAARAPKPLPEEPSAPAEPADAAAGLAEPGKASPPPGIEDEPAKSAEGDQLALVQVHEQFDFCAQLLGQGAFGDHYDTCLCKDAREAAPYRGRRGFYVSAKKKEAGAGQLETSAKIVSSKITDGTATVKARWKSGSSDKGRDSTQLWKLEDGLWCQAQ